MIFSSLNNNKARQRFDDIEWREKGMYCEDCGQDFPKESHHDPIHWDADRKVWTCNPKDGRCNTN